MTSICTGAAGFSRHLLSGAAAIALLAPFTVFAQSADGDQYEAQEDNSTGNTIIVTATKREQTLQEIPVAVTVTTAETLQRENIRDLQDLQTVVPSLRVGQLQSSANTNFIIRGFGNGANNIGIEPSVGVFVDGVYRSRTASQINDLPNVSRVEVLRGPQSTLFGKNASAGIISMVTSEPSFTNEGTAELTYGNFDAIVAKLYLTGPISESLAFSIAGGVNKRDGYIEDAATGNDTNNRQRGFVRGQLLWDNGSNARFRMIADYDTLNENCCAVVNVRPSLYTQAIQLTGGQVNAPSAAFDDVVYNNFDSTNDVQNYGVSGQFDIDLSDVFTLTSITAYRETVGDFAQDVDFTSADLLQRYNQQKFETFTQEVRLAADFGRLSGLIGAFYFDESVREDQQVLYGDGFRPFANVLTTQLLGSSLTEAEGLIGQLTTGSPATYIGTFFAPGVVESGRFSMDNEALSLFGQFDFEVTDRLTLTLGANYTMDDKAAATDYQSYGVFSNIDLVFARDNAFNAGVSQAVCAQISCTGPGGFATPQEIGQFAVNNMATYNFIVAQATTAADAILQAQALQNFPRFVNIPNSVEDATTSDNDFSWTARLAYDITDDVNIYASYATGFKASSFALSRDSRPLSSDAAALQSAGLLFNNQTFGSRFAGPEESEVFEIGLKADWGDYSMNLTGFRQDIDGFQSNVFTGTGFFLANAGKQRTYGVEFEGMANPIDQLTLNAAITWLDPSYQSFPDSPFGDISGTTPAGISEWSGSFSAQWDQPMPNGDRLILRSTYYYESEVKIVDGLPGFLDATLPDGGVAQAIAAADPFTREVNELSASITYSFVDLGLDLSVWGRNLTDDRYFISLFDSPAQPGSISAYPNQPRTYGVTARYRFGD